MQLRFEKDFTLDESGFPVEGDMYIISLEGNFGLSVWSCKHKCFIEQYTLAAAVHLNRDLHLIEQIEQLEQVLE